MQLEGLGAVRSAPCPPPVPPGRTGRAGVSAMPRGAGAPPRGRRIRRQGMGPILLPSLRKPQGESGHRPCARGVSLPKANAIGDGGGGTMRIVGNIIWILLGGIWTAMGWLFVGLVLCISVVGIPLGLQCFKMASLTLTPFGKEIVYGGGAPSLVANIFWVLLAGIPMALAYLVAGVLTCVTVVGIPFGLQSFKMAKLALMPFGAQVR